MCGSAVVVLWFVLLSMYLSPCTHVYTHIGGDDRSTEQETSQMQRPPASLFSMTANAHSQGLGRGPGEADSERSSITAGGGIGSFCQYVWRALFIIFTHVM